MSNNNQEKIVLNIGGTIFHTKMETLTESYILRRLVQGQQSGKKEVFLDRDGSLFREVLYYMRHGKLFEDSNEKNLKRLVMEAKFYGLPRLVDKIYSILERESVEEDESKINSMLFEIQSKVDTILDVQIKLDTTISENQSKINAAVLENQVKVDAILENQFKTDAILDEIRPNKIDTILEKQSNMIENIIANESKISTILERQQQQSNPINSLLSSFLYLLLGK